MFGKIKKKIKSSYKTNKNKSFKKQKKKMNDFEYDHLYKILLIGESGVGKSSFVNNLIMKHFRNFSTNHIF